jgi:NAD(P)H-nitrite reductase large subunit
MHYLIIGNSAAGIGAAEAIRKIDTESQLTILSEEAYHAYSRPLIAEYLSNSIDIDRMWYRQQDFYQKNNIKLLLNTRVERIDPDSKKVFTASGAELSFDKLLIATGGTPIIPPIEGKETNGVYTFVRWDEVKRLKENQPEIKKAVVIGGGLIGLKATEHMSKSGVDVTIVELAETLLGAVLDKNASNILKHHFENFGVTVFTENTVSKIHSNDGRASTVTLQDGTEVACDAVIIAIGVKPDMEILNNTSITRNKGIIVNEKLQTNYPDIYAAGDVAEAFDLLIEENRVLPIWPTAYRQGYIAGLNMAGHERIYCGGISMNSLEFFDLPIISAGFTTAEDESFNEEIILNEKNKVYKKIIIKDNKLAGFIYVNKIDRAGILTGLIQDKTDITSFKDEILKDSFGLIDLPEDVRERKFKAVSQGV